MLVPRPPARLGVEKEPLFIIVGDVVVQVLCKCKLAMKLVALECQRHGDRIHRWLRHSYLLERNSIVLKKEEAIVAYGGLGFLYQICYDGRVIRVKQCQIDRLQLREVVFLLGRGRGLPIWNQRLARQV